LGFAVKGPRFGRVEKANLAGGGTGEESPGWREAIHLAVHDYRGYFIISTSHFCKLFLSRESHKGTALVIQDPLAVHQIR
jgi:hypothetical protein